MKLLAVIFCLVVSMGALGQSADTASNYKSIPQLLQHLKTQPGTSDPLIMLDDSVYKGDINKINSNDIESIDVLKGSDDTKKVFGPGAEHGVFMMKTRQYVNRGMPANTGIAPLPEKHNVLYLVDGVPESKEQINQDSIFSKDVLKGDRLNTFLSALHTEGRIDSVVIITTKKDAISACRAKFGALSKSYSAYIKKYNDTDMDYVINGKQVTGSADEVIRILYDLSPDKIASVGVIDHHKDTAVLKSVVVIITKQ